MSSITDRREGSAIVRDKITKDQSDGVRQEQSQQDAALDHIREALIGLQFGEVLLVLQDGVIVQLERTERKRFRKAER
jgi:hypothetical protein